MSLWRPYKRTHSAGVEPARCQWCGNRLRRPKRMNGEPMYAKPGDYGDGLFCGLRCGYQYGVSNYVPFR